MLSFLSAQKNEVIFAAFLTSNSEETMKIKETIK